MATGAKRQGDDPVPEADLPKYEGLLKTAQEKVEALKAWKEKLTDIEQDELTQQFVEDLRKALGFCSVAFNILRDYRQLNNLSDQLAETIVDTRNYLGEGIMPLSKYHMFNRGQFSIGGQTLIAHQYFEEIPYYGAPRKPNPADRLEITKFFCWQLIDKPKDSIVPGTPVDCVYYLEKGTLNSVYYVLGMTQAGMIHASLSTFHDGRPTFFQLEELIVKRIVDMQQGNKPATSLIASSHRAQ